jgi:hypothetical protein
MQSMKTGKIGFPCRLCRNERENIGISMFFTLDASLGSCTFYLLAAGFIKKNGPWTRPRHEAPKWSHNQLIGITFDFRGI